MNILFVRGAPLGDPGAAASHYFPKTLARLGHRVAVATPSGAARAQAPGPRVEVCEIEPGASWWGSLRSVARRFRPQIVHVFIHHGCGAYPLILRGSGGTKFVLDIRSPAMKTGPARALRQWKNAFESMGYHAVTAHGVKSGRTKIGWLRKIHWVPGGVDFSVLPPLSADLGERPVRSPARLVYTGSLSPKRKISRMIEAVALASKSVPLTLDLYAYDDPPGEVLRCIEKMGVGDRIRLLSPMPRDQLFSRLMDYDIGLAYVPRTPFDPAPPLKTMEFLACGLPVVATNTTGNRLFVRPRENGLLAGESPSQFAEGICELANAVWYPMARKVARATVEAFDWERIVRERLIPVYRLLIDRGRSGNQ